jgi:SAM-dependent methyltransferase
MTDTPDPAPGPPAAAPGSADGFNYSGAELDALAEARNYYTWITRRLAPYLGARTLEVGAGIGTFTEYLLGARSDTVVTAVEPAANNFPHLERRFRGNPRVRTLPGYLDETVAPGQADAVVAINVMEHVPDDRAFVRAAARALAPGGHLCIFVPALPWLFGTLDEAFEHYRRYTRRTLAALLPGSGLEPLELRYVNLPGVAAWWLSGKVLRRRTISPAQARTYDRLVVPLVAAVEQRWSPPIGQSLLLVARKSPDAAR